MHKIKVQIKKLLPDFLKNIYHCIRAFFAGLKYGFPAKKMIVIGITGTKGKTSTANFVWSVLQTGGYKTGLISTAIFRFGEREELNNYHMTMPDSFVIQKNLAKMLEEGIQVVVVEMTSEGMKQYRHFGIPVDIAIFTNLTPEHLPSHKNNFEVYKKAKTKLFTSLSSKPKTFQGKIVPRSIIVNSDSEHADYYLQFPADKKIKFGMNGGDIHAENISSDKQGVYFDILGEKYTLSILGAFNIYNALPAIGVARIFDIPNDKIKKGLVSLAVIPGRMEQISEGQDFSLFVDYAHEPVSINAVLTSAEKIKNPDSKIIILFGAEGGGRDTRKRKPMAELCAQKADYVIVTDVDSYDDDPQKIVDDVSFYVEVFGKTRDKNLFAILDRKQAIKKAISLAKKDDIVIITGKGAEQTMITGGKTLPWNEREIVKGLLIDQLKNN